MTIYKPDGVVLKSFIEDESFVSILQGPVGGGKSVASIMKILKFAMRQRRGRDGVRRTRWGIIRSTFQQLQDTTVKTWLDWFPENVYGTFVRSKPFRHVIRFRSDEMIDVDGRKEPVGDVELEAIFLALDTEEDRQKLLSWELTGAWVNEARETIKGIIDDLTARVGRYPSMRDGGATWSGIIMDTNAPSEEHWIPIMRGDVPFPEYMNAEDRRALEKPDEWKFFVQPSALIEEKDSQGEVTGWKPNPLAENVKNLRAGYYMSLIDGKTKGWVDVYVMNRLGALRAGKPVFPGFNVDLHVSKKRIEPVPHLPILIGVDFGRTPAALFGQCVRGRWFILHELVCEDMGAVTFAPILKKEIAQKFPGYQFKIWGDPSGDYKGQEGERTPYMIFRTNGLPIMPAPGHNSLSVRLGAVEGVLNRMVDGYPGMLVSPGCTTFKAGMAGGYKFRQLRVSNRDVYSDEPEKNNYSHVCDAGQYLLVGGGEGRMLTTGTNERPKPPNTVRHVNVLGRGPGGRRDPVLVRR